MQEYHIDNNFKSEWRKKILNWYLLNKRDLPWRKPENQNFYKIWISEIMLQQTQVSVVIPYYKKFFAKWPNLEDFFDAKLEEILFIWQGMGYYKRAHNLFKAKELLKKKKIIIKSTFLKEFPGIGEYTSSAISAILMNETCAVVDGNIKRILTRVFKLKFDNRFFEKKIKEISTFLTPNSKNGEYCQALMDLANLICKVKNPDCKKCPIFDLCKSKGSIIQFKKKRINVQKVTVAFVLNYQESFLIEKNSKNLLQNLFCFPMSEFHEINKKSFKKKLFLNRMVLKWTTENKVKYSYQLIGEVTHKFTHFQLKVLIVKLRLFRKFKNKDFFWLTTKELNEKPVSKLMLKIREQIE